MGMYTEFHFNVELDYDIPKDIIYVLQHMIGNVGRPSDLPHHPLFKTDRWEHMLTMDSYYFDADTHTTLRHDEIAKAYYLCIRCNFKNYDDEITKFLDWIHPYLSKDSRVNKQFLGFYRYEESQHPTLLYNGPQRIEKKTLGSYNG